MSVAVDAELRLLPESEDGRAESIRSGYRSIMRFGSADAEPPWGVQIDFERDELPPGETATVQVSTWADADPAISPGTPIWLYEGSHLVGTGTIR